MAELVSDLRLALDRVAFAEELGILPDPWQRELLASSSPRILMSCSRQSGKSTMAALSALHRALHYPGSLVLCLAPSERQSKELFGKITAFHRRLGMPSPASDRKLGMHLPNGSRIEALPGTEKTIRGFSGVDLLILDEAARVDDALYYSVRPMLAVSGGSLMMLSSPYGKRGVFFEEWTNGEGWERYEIPADKCPRISPEFLEAERASMPAWWFRQEYECRFEETEDQIFTHDMIASARADELGELTFEGADQLWT
jgi:hypothetical protein